MRAERSCGGVVLRENDDGCECLLIRQIGGDWGFPKGHIEKGESELETAAREIKEETGIVAELDPEFKSEIMYHLTPNIVKNVVYFLGTKPQGAERPQEAEIMEVKWAKLEER